MSDNEKREFFCDMREIDWRRYVRDSITGTAICIMGENHVAPEHGLQ